MASLDADDVASLDADAATSFAAEKQKTGRDRGPSPAVALVSSAWFS